jgi:hypothetical protein
VLEASSQLAYWVHGFIVFFKIDPA